MRGGSPRSRGNAGWRKVIIDGEHLLTVGSLLREAGVPAGEGEPILAHGHRDRAGNWRRIHARYASALRVTLVIRVDETYSLSMAIKFVCRKDAPAGD